MPHLIDVNQYYLVGRREVDFVKPLVNKAGGLLNHEVSLEIGVVANRGSDGKL